MGLPSATPDSRLASTVDWAGLGCVVLVALGVRLVFQSDALSFDETQHFLVAKSPLLDDFLREFRLRAHPPLAYLLMKPFVALSPSVYWVRMAALLCGLASVVVVYLLLEGLLGRVLRARWPVLLGTLLIALAPLFVKQSSEARHYSLCLLLVWASLWLWQRMRESDFERGSDHLMLAALQLLALLSDYSASFAVAALSLVIYSPLVVRSGTRGEWGRIARWALPQVAVAAAAAGLFLWHFEAAAPSYSHMETAVYLGGSGGGSGGGNGEVRSLLDVAAVGAFLWRQLGFFQNAILPAPFGLAVLSTLALGFAPWLRDDPHARVCRSFAIYALVALALSMAASLLGLFPFGGRPRHNAVLVPGILLTSFLGVALSLRVLRPRLQGAAAVALVALVLFGIGMGLQRGLSGREIYERQSLRLGVPRYRASPASIVANWRGRSYAGWWYLPDGSPHQTDALAGERLFDYGGVRVTESESPELIVARALRGVKQSGEVWVVLSHFREQGTEHLRRVVAAVQREVAQTDGVELVFSAEAHFFPPLAVLNLQAPRASGAPASSAPASRSTTRD